MNEQSPVMKYHHAKQEIELIDIRMDHNQDGNDKWFTTLPSCGKQFISDSLRDCSLGCDLNRALTVNIRVRAL